MGILTSSDTYSRYYGDFKGVDFSSDHTQVHEQRLAYAVNMYKDYQSGQGRGLETIPGFRRRVIIPDGDGAESINKEIYGIHTFRLRDEDGKHSTRVLIHAGTRLYEWSNYPEPCGVNQSATITLDDPIETEGNVNVFQVDFHALEMAVIEIVSIYADNGSRLYTDQYSFDRESGVLTITDSTLRTDRKISITYLGNRLSYDSAVFTNMNERKSTSFVFNNRLYLIDGKNYLVYDGENVSSVLENAYIPTTHINIIPSGENADAGTQKEQRNMLQPKFKHTFIADGRSTKFYMNENELDMDSIEVRVYGVVAERVFADTDGIYEDSEGNVFHFDENGEQYYFEANGTKFYLDKNREKYYLDETGAAYYLDHNGDEYTVPSGDELYYFDDSGEKCYYDTSGNKYYLNDDGKRRYPDEPFESVNKKIYAYYFDERNGLIRFMFPPARPEHSVQTDVDEDNDPDMNDVMYPEFYAGIEVTASRQQLDDNGAPFADSITKCTIATVFDNRVFLSGNPDYPNRIFWSALNNATYFPVINWDDEGVGDSPVTGMLAVADSLMVLKADTRQDGSVYFHTPMETGDDLNPKIYPSSQGLSGTGCLGACINFLDDPVFVSRLGLEAMGQLSVRLERAIEHRSSLVDAKLVNLDLSKAMLEEWNGYLCLMVDGKIFMADSRQRYTHDTGAMQYEWYYLEDIGIYTGQYSEYRYAAGLHELEGAAVEWCPTCSDDFDFCPCSGEGVTLELKIADDVYMPEYMGRRSLVGQTLDLFANEDARAAMPSQVRMFVVDEDGNKQTVIYNDAFYAVRTLKDEFTGELISREAYLLDKPGNMIGGEFKPAVCLKTIDDNLFFGTTNGVLCSFNFDMRDENGDIPTSAYSFDGRTILCGCATKMDNCGVPHLTKNTLKKSTVIKTKTLPSAAAKIKIRTNRKPYEQIARISSKTFSFDDMDFSDFSFVTGDQSLFAIKEKEKKWVEKQHFIYSDEYLKPFALYYIAFRYNIAGRYKQ